MNIQEIFLKPVDRHIDGVIKADDDLRLLTEIEEYVITDEVRKALDKFLNQYLDSKVVNGVWISGFFGSGKSHLLKMLALLLENRVVEGHHALDLFLPKTNTDAIFKSNLDKACKIPSKSILFNIAQKANIVNKDHSDALLSTFIKVFDEMCGYFGKQGYIAQFERDLLSERVKSGLAAARARGKKLGRQPGQRPKSDKVAEKVVNAVAVGRSYRWIARDLAISKNTVLEIMKRHRQSAL